MDDMTGFQPMTRYPTAHNDSYAYWGWYGPSQTKTEAWQGAIVFFILIPLVVLGLITIGALLLVALAVPPVGIVAVKALMAS